MAAVAHTSIMVDVVVVFLALGVSSIFGISAWVAVIAFRKARRGQDIALPLVPSGGLFGGGSAQGTDSSAWLGDSGSASGDGGGN